MKKLLASCAILALSAAVAGPAMAGDNPFIHGPLAKHSRAAGQASTIVPAESHLKEQASGLYDWSSDQVQAADDLAQLARIVAQMDAGITAEQEARRPQPSKRQFLEGVLRSNAELAQAVREGNTELVKALLSRETATQGNASTVVGNGENREVGKGPGSEKTRTFRITVFTKKVGGTWYAKAGASGKWHQLINDQYFDVAMGGGREYHIGLKKGTTPDQYVHGKTGIGWEQVGHTVITIPNEETDGINDTIGVVAGFYDGGPTGAPAVGDFGGSTSGTDELPTEEVEDPKPAPEAAPAKPAGPSAAEIRAKARADAAEARIRELEAKNACLDGAIDKADDFTIDAANARAACAKN